MLKKHIYIIGNWKMHGSAALAEALIADIALQTSISPASVVVCPSALLIERMVALCKGTAVNVGAQDCHQDVSGAFTGSISAVQLAEAGARYVIVGHSERRQQYDETNEMVRSKAQAAVDAGLTPIICVGETLAQRRSGEAVAAVAKQLKESTPDHHNADFLLAYEPVWAIGSGLTPTTSDILEMHQMIHQSVPSLGVLYGGSVKAANASSILKVDAVDGVLVGGASLSADEFCSIIKSADALMC